jgi:hypothetical protein
MTTATLGVTLALGLLALPLAIQGQPGKVYRVGLVFDTSPVSERAGSHPSVRAPRRSCMVSVPWDTLKGRTSS